MRYYEVPFSDAPTSLFTQPVQAGSWSLDMEFQWPEEIQEMWDEFHQSIAHLGADDPLVMMSGYSRDYNYIQLYTSIEDIDIFLQQKEGIPLSVANAPADKRTVLVEQRIAECTALKQYEDELKEHLKWTVSIHNQHGDINVATVEPGGWYMNQSETFSFKFYSTKDYIGYDDLRYVSLIVRTE